MSESDTIAELVFHAEAGRAVLRKYLEIRLKAGASTSGITFGMAAMLGEICARSAMSGRLDELLESVRNTVTAYADLSLNAQATSGAGHA